MSEIERRHHEEWLGMVQPAEGLVVSVPVLVDAQCAEKSPRELHAAFTSLLMADDASGARRLRIADLPALFETVLDLPPSRFLEEAALPKEVSLYVPEGKQALRPTRALLNAKGAASPYAMLVWEVPSAVTDLDKPETETGAWEYPAQAKFERLLREVRCPIGVLSNGWELRLVYAPHGESSGWLAFRAGDMAGASGRPIFDAMVMLLGRARWFAVAPERQLPALLAESRRRSADVTNDLARQVFEALEVLLAGFAAAEDRDGSESLRAAIERGDDHLYAGLLTVLLRLVFLLYCEDRALLPVEHPVFSEHYSVLGLFAELQADQGRYPDTMHRRFGAYSRLVALFRAVFLGVHHVDASGARLDIPPRRGDLFDPNAYPFLEGWGEGSAPIHDPSARAGTAVPTVDDGTIYTVLDKLLFLGGQRLSYKALDVEQIGSVYEALMGFDVVRLDAGAVRIRLGSKKGAARVWVSADALLAEPKARRAAWLMDELGFDKTVAAKIAEAVSAAKTAEVALDALAPLSGKRAERASAGTLVLQPGVERRRTSSHYTPRELTEPIVERTLAPLIRAMGDAPSSETILNLVICDPAMGSGAFLVAACRYLGDHVVAAWTREEKLHLIADAHDDVVNHARRLVAQRCLYGVDKNRYAVQLARLSLWLVTMARREPFTFVDHALRHGDSLVGLDFDQIRAFHWAPRAQTELATNILQEALNEAIAIRQQILALAADGSDPAQREKERLLLDAEDALSRARLVADLVVGAFFAHVKDKDREKERDRRLELVAAWLAADRAGDGEKTRTLRERLDAMQADLRATQVPFHWMLEFPEVFFAERPDPLDGNRPNGKAYVEAFVGNPPFMGKNGISQGGGEAYLPWLLALHPGSHGNADLSAHFFRRAAELVGEHGTIGLIATNTIAQGDTRSTGLQALVGAGFRIYAATPTLPWPGDAAVTVSVVHLGHGTALPAGCELDGKPVSAINSMLRVGAERTDATQLASNASFSYQGSVVLGMGFTLTPAERDVLVAKSLGNAERIFPYLGGEEVNSSPTQSFERYVISFGQMTLEEAERWPDLIGIVREKVKPERDKQNPATADGRDYRARWWQYAKVRNTLYDAIAPLPRCLATSRHSKHLVFSFQPSKRIFSEATYVFPLDRFTAFAVLQSRVHEPWARLLSSSLEDRLRYAASDCFETFPFPKPDPRAVLPAVEAAGQALYDARAAFMVETNQGLTKTYNALKDPANEDPRVLHLRELHQAMDRAVTGAYGWTDLDVPPYCPLDDEAKAKVKAFEDAVVDRLFALNAERAKAEAGAVRGKGGAEKGAKAKKKKGGPMLPGMG